MKLTETQWRGLAELGAAVDERIKFFNSEWVRTRDMSGTQQERGSANMKLLAAKGLAEGKKPGAFNNPQAQFVWTITPAGRAALESRND